MKTKIELKDGVRIHQSLTEFDWKRGYIDGYVNSGAGPVAVVVTESNELEFVPIHAMRVVDQ